MTTSVARRPDSAPRPAQAQGSAALAIRAGQAMWDDRQAAALVALGIPKAAPKADLAVFLHQCQRTGLDPFSRQIYLIYRRTREGDRWVDKPTTQVGIDGYRVIRDRIATRTGARVEYEDTLWYDAAGQAWDVWLSEEPPAACRVVVVVDGRRFPGVVRFNAYAQRGKDGNLVSQWKTQPDHMIEKCAEAFALRRAFPNDLGGLALEDEIPPQDPAAPPPAQRATAEQIRQRRQPATISAEVIGDGPEDTAPEQAAPAARKSTASRRKDAAEPKTAGRDGTAAAIVQHFSRLGIEDRDERLGWTSRLAGLDEHVKTTNDLTAEQQRQVVDALGRCRDMDALIALLATGETGDEPQDGEP